MAQLFIHLFTFIVISVTLRSASSLSKAKGKIMELYILVKYLSPTLILKLQPLLEDIWYCKGLNNESCYICLSPSYIVYTSCFFCSNASSDGEKSVTAAVGDTVELRCEFRVSGWSAIEW